MIPGVLITPRPIRLRLRRVRWLRHNAVRRQWLRQTSAYSRHRHFHQAIADRIQRQDGLGRWTRGSRRSGLLLANYLRQQTNHCAKTSFLQFGKMPSKVWEWTKVVFAPTGRIPPLPKVKHRGVFSARLLDG